MASHADCGTAGEQHRRVLSSRTNSSNARAPKSGAPKGWSA